MNVTCAVLSSVEAPIGSGGVCFFSYRLLVGNNPIISAQILLSSDRIGEEGGIIWVQAILLLLARSAGHSSSDRNPIGAPVCRYVVLSVLSTGLPL
jgi:hypothetical protein